jgi:hypothetical protein
MSSAILDLKMTSCQLFPMTGSAILTSVASSMSADEGEPARYGGRETPSRSPTLGRFRVAQRFVRGRPFSVPDSSLNTAQIGVIEAVSIVPSSIDGGWGWDGIFIRRKRRY